MFLTLTSTICCKKLFVRSSKRPNSRQAEMASMMSRERAVSNMLHTMNLQRVSGKRGTTPLLEEALRLPDHWSYAGTISRARLPSLLSLRRKVIGFWCLKKTEYGFSTLAFLKRFSTEMYPSSTTSKCEFNMKNYYIVNLLNGAEALLLQCACMWFF